MNHHTLKKIDMMHFIIVIFVYSVENICIVVPWGETCYVFRSYSTEIDKAFSIPSTVSDKPASLDVESYIWLKTDSDKGA